MYFTLSDGTKLYYEDTGKGKNTLVMMHGVTSNHRVFEKPVEVLSEKARCITYDHRGHCNSRYSNSSPVTTEMLADDLNELINGLSLENVTLFGWSMGAGAAMTYIKKYGCDKLKQLVLCDMSPRQLNDENWNLGLDKGKYDMKAMKKAENNSFKKIARDFMKGVAPKLKYAPFFVVNRFLRNIMSECNEEIISELFESMKLQDNRDFMSDLTVPLTYIYARPGSLFAPRLAQWYREQAKEAGIRFRAVGIKDSSHLLIYEHPYEFAYQITRLI